jgi:hypothetical protein
MITADRDGDTVRVVMSTRDASSLREILSDTMGGCAPDVEDEEVSGFMWSLIESIRKAGVTS